MRSRPKFALLVGRYWTVPRAHDRPEVTITLYSNPHVSLCSFNEGCERSRDTDVVACQVSRRQNNLRQGSRPVSVAQVGVELCDRRPFDKGVRTVAAKRDAEPESCKNLHLHLRNAGKNEHQGHTLIYLPSRSMTCKT